MIKQLKKGFYKRKHCVFLSTTLKLYTVYLAYTIIAAHFEIKNYVLWFKF